MQGKSFFYIFVFVVIVAMGYVVYAMYSMPKLGENNSAHNTIMIKSVAFLS